MKADELMLDDWVEGLDSTHKERVYAQVDAIEESRRCLLVKDGWGNWFLDIKHLEPIPLTEEILLSNGFYYTYYAVSETFSYRLMVANINGNYIEIRLDKKTIGVWLDYDENGDGVYSDYLLPLPCYVHEFQHALRLCGIEKTIEL